MSVAEIVYFSKEHAAVDEVIQEAVEALKRVEKPQHFVIGTLIQDKDIVQITSEWDGVLQYTGFENTAEFDLFSSSVRNSLGESKNIFHIALNRSAFDLDGPATAKVVEFAQSYFPASRVTAEFQKQIEEDFLRFDEIYIKGAKGTLSWASGWVLEEQEHENLMGEKAKCFIIIRGWESMEHFEQSVNSDAYKEAIPILFAWNVPFKMWHIERKAHKGIKIHA